ncbi:hypothetical protein GCM10022223_58980 [Kineosporia mesophila]|uniref:Uncharacterized protein n=1 Tax=Kineosporia mesophila TaxID=566012 RepID=A0ABP7AHL7_9ACTN
MTSVASHIRSSEPRHASATVRRIGAGLLAVVVSAIPSTLVIRAVSGDDAAEIGRPVHRVVDVRCLNGRVQHGIDTGRPDGLLLATDTGEPC